eukprot:CAMPEP_0115835700 /NCGR_PEP_ID=MMETSP0287-20121206/4329_1 /TAXON_ID=412157 /ORGANISM="Chrysochromulina rotalis, Strain UIO044" /LENGTH=126 /DNA_ID=CAMNT_0003289165 /DNA_START=351 /DNA_END=729 /DNA_ORIENTATION=+
MMVARSGGGFAEAGASARHIGQRNDLLRQAVVHVSQWRGHNALGTAEKPPTVLGQSCRLRKARWGSALSLRGRAAIRLAVHHLVFVRPSEPLAETPFVVLGRHLASRRYPSAELSPRQAAPSRPEK